LQQVMDLFEGAGLGCLIQSDDIFFDRKVLVPRPLPAKALL